MWSFYEGPPTANGRPGAHHVLSRVFKDIYPRFKTMRGLQRPAQGRLGLPRAAGRARGRARARALVEGRDRGLRDRRVQRPLPRVGLPLRRGLEPAHRADRLLDRPRGPLRHARQRLHRVGVVGAAADLGRRPPVQQPQGRPVLPALRDRAVLARGRARLPRRRGPVGLCRAADRLGAAERRAPGDGAARGRPAARLDDDAMDADLQRRGRGRARDRLRPRARPAGSEEFVRRGAGPRRAGAGRGRGGARPVSRAPRSPARATSRRSPTSPTTGRSGTACSRPTSSPPADGTGLVHTAIAFGEDDFRLGEQYGIKLQNPGPPRRHLRRAHHRLRRAAS